MYLTWSSFNNIRLLMMAFKPIVIFYLIWLVNTSETIRSEEGTLLDLVCWPDGNAIPVVITCASVIAVIIQLYGLYQLFRAGLPKKDHDVTNGLFYYIWALIIMIIVFLAIMFYSGLQSTIIRAKIKDGISKAMLRYATHLPSKVAIDRLQTRFHCCGRVTYEEWFYIACDGHKFVADNVPYSCCSMEAMCPCIHHGVSHTGTFYKYDPQRQLTIWQAGCEEKLINEMMTVSWRFNAVMGLSIVAMIVQLVAARYLHTAYRNGLHIGNQVICESYLLRSITDVDVMACKLADRKVRRRSSRSRTSQWVAASYSKLGSATTTSSTDLNSSDEVLKPIVG
ncbi:hypothetical protein JYU34_018644 [Plutella xylostella]|uniref:Tetraspanin n=1 Tax=Plutella xylostella TaxID=51655 RepID=A0ABQ7PYA7_PLUXY|nr:hypothetical protein JYU34_018644 [Plutella xylostella]